MTDLPRFWDQFVAVVYEADLPVISKFTYLKNFLEVEAKSSIDGLSLKAVNYEVARTILAERYAGSPELELKGTAPR